MLNLQSRKQAWLAIVAILFAFIAVLWDADRLDKWPVRNVAYNDIALYRDVAAQIGTGAGYYETTTRLQRSHHYPTRPFFTVRHPTLAYLAATFGWARLQQALLALMAMAAAAWLVRIEHATVLERAAAILALVAGSAAIFSPLLVAVHDVWAGLLICLALVLRNGKAWWLGLVAVAAAIAFRELAICYGVLSLIVSVAERRRAESLAWLGILALGAAGIALHASLVHAATLPGDPVSQGWLGLRGPGAAFYDLAGVSVLALLPTRAAMGLALLALVGWAAAPVEQRTIILLFLGGFIVLIGVFARSQNFYWVLMTLPTWLIGLAFVPRALRDLCAAALAPRPSPL